MDSSARQVFEQATADRKGVKFELLSVREQVVAGRNYQFLCNMTAVYPGAPTTQVLIDIYKPLNGDPTVTSITPVSK